MTSIVIFGGSQYRLSPEALLRTTMPGKDTIEFWFGVGYDDRSMRPEIIIPKSTIMLSAQGDWGICPLTGMKYPKVDGWKSLVTNSYLRLCCVYAALSLILYPAWRQLLLLSTH